MATNSHTSNRHAVNQVQRLHAEVQILAYDDILDQQQVFLAAQE